MKKILLLIITFAMITSCNMSSESKKDDKKSQEIGSSKLDNGEINPIIVGNLDNQQIWLDYIKAHNEKNLEKIAEINADDWIGFTAEGSVAKGSDTHIEILDNWFKAANPKWEVKWMIANAAKNEEGIMEQWLTTGSNYSDTDENGEDIFEHNIHDIKFINGKIKEIRVYKRTKAEETKDFSY